MQQPTQRSGLFIITLLGALSVVTPFAIDMYLTAYLQIAKEFEVSSSTIALTISAYFVGVAAGQLFYGPMLDHFGRKKPLAVGLLIFIAASLGCAFTTNVTLLIILRFIQGIGGCGANVASPAMVRDFFPPDKTARILSLLFLFIAVSPLLAPTFGNFVIMVSGWRAVFILLALIVAGILALIWFLMPEGHQPDPGISLKPLPILKEYAAIMRQPCFGTYALAGAFSFAGLFTYVAGSPIIFMEKFHLSAAAYSGVFALLACGFIGGSQLNVLLLKKFDSKTLFARVLSFQVFVNLLFLLGTWQGWYGFVGTLVMFFISLSCSGITYPNAAATALSPFKRNVGSAAALLGFLQLGIGALISSGISMSKTSGSLPIIAILAVTTSLGLIIWVFGHKRAHASLATAHDL
jgi:DHA1 family bicyclomycin/chloramphenicol resistance-like MFS transporter